jgi:hypothetical protein
MACVTLGPDEVEIPDAVAETLEQDGVLWFDPIATSQWHGYVYHPMGTSISELDANFGKSAEYAFDPEYPADKEDA